MKNVALIVRNVIRIINSHDHHLQSLAYQINHQSKMQKKKLASCR